MAQQKQRLKCTKSLRLCTILNIFNIDFNKTLSKVYKSITRYLASMILNFLSKLKMLPEFFYSKWNNFYKYSLKFSKITNFYWKMSKILRIFYLIKTLLAVNPFGASF